MAIQKEFVLRYRNDGHVRFQIPARLCEASVAKLINDHIAAIDGVYAVSVYRGQNKLSIRYRENVCDFNTLANRLFVLLAELEQQGCFEVQTELVKGNARILKKISDNRVTHWFGEKYQAAKETVQAAKLVGKLSSKGPKALIKDPEKAVIELFKRCAGVIPDQDSLDAHHSGMAG